jgi:hypothetical protein
MPWQDCQTITKSQNSDRLDRRRLARDPDDVGEPEPTGAALPATDGPPTAWSPLIAVGSSSPRAAVSPPIRQRRRFSAVCRRRARHCKTVIDNRIKVTIDGQPENSPADIPV